MGSKRQRTTNLEAQGEGRYRHTFDNAIEGIYKTSSGGRFELANPALARILGFDSPQDLVGRAIGVDFQLYVDSGRRATLVDLLEAENRVLGFESEVRRRDGTVIWVSENINAVRDEVGRLIGLEGSLVEITEQKKAALELQASEARYRELVDSLPQPVFELDSRGVPTYVNRAALKWYGPSVDRLLQGGNVLLELVVPEQRKLTYQAFKRTLEGERRSGIELIAIRGDGEEVPVLVFTTPIEHDGKVAGARVLAIDIGSQKRVEAEMRKSEERQNAILRSLPVAVYTAEVPSSTDAAWMSDSVQRFTGFPATRFMTEPGFWSSRLHPEDAARTVEEYRQGAERGEAIVEYRWKVADGSYRWFVDSALRVRKRDGIAEMTGIIRDITVEKEAEDAVRRSERYYRGLFDGAHDSILVFDPDSEEILDANDAACRLYQWSRDELIGMSLRNLSKNAESGRHRIKETVESRTPVHFETVQLRRDGMEVLLEVNASVVEYHGRTAILSVNRDITERRTFEARLSQADKMEAMGRLAAGVAHDFNNMLGVILGTTDLAMAASDSRDLSHERIKTIRHAAARGRELVDALLGFSRRQILQCGVLDLGAVVQGIEPMLRGALPTSIEIRIVRARHRVTVSADQGQIEQMVLNLAVNSRDAMPEGGRLTIEIEAAIIGEDFVAGRPWARVGRYGRLRVIDTGVGMDDAVVARALEPFFTTKGPAGTGLGLTSVYGIAKQHDGVVEIMSEPGGGTSVDVYLPWVEDEAPAEDQLPRTEDLVLGCGERILLAEDDPDLGEVTAAMVAQLGYSVTVVADGQEALEVMAAAAEPFDLVVTDLTMPRMGGIEFYKECCEREAKVPFVFTSGYDEAASSAGLPSGPHLRFLRKPYNMAALGKTIASLLKHEV